MWASLPGHEEVVKLLIAAGADLQAKSEVRGLKLVPAQIICCYGVPVFGVGSG
jgi:ankyrin repeat protein